MKRLALLLLLSCAIVSAAEESSSPAEPSVLWKWANFAILAVGLGYLMGKMLPPFFANRTSEIQKGIAEAQVMKRDAEKRAAEMEARLKTLGADIENFKAQSAAEMHQEGERIRQDTAAQIKRIEEQAAAEIESAGKTARRELRDYAAGLAFELAEQRIRASLDSATEGSIVESFVNDLKRQPSKGTNN